MPMRPHRPCRFPGCTDYGHGSLGYCDKHEHELKKSWDITREKAVRQLYTTRGWSFTRWRKLKEDPLCLLCKQEGRTEKATVVDHIIDHRGDRSMFFDRDNLQSLCKYHHDKKTGTERGFGSA